MGFDRNRLPDAATYFDGQGLRLVGRGKWRTTECRFHGGSDSMRINTVSGVFVCMNCGAKGGDLLAYHMAEHGMDFITAAKDLGAWTDSDTPYTGPTRPAAIPARALLQVVAFELTVCAMVLSDMLAGKLTDADNERFSVAAGRVIHIAGVANG